MYWFSRAGPAASARIYYEITGRGALRDIKWSSIPLGLSYFPKEVAIVPKLYVPPFVYMLTHANDRLDGPVRSEMSCTSRTMSLAGTLQRSSGLRTSRTMFARCSPKAALRSES